MVGKCAAEDGLSNEIKVAAFRALVGEWRAHEIAMYVVKAFVSQMYVLRSILLCCSV